AMARGVKSAMAVATGLALPNGGEVLALDPSKAAATALLRADQSALPARALWRRLIPARAAATITLPGRPARLEIDASLARVAGSAFGAADLTVSIADGQGTVYSVPVGILAADGHSHALVV